MISKRKYRDSVERDNRKGNGKNREQKSNQAETDEEKGTDFT